MITNEQNRCAIEAQPVRLVQQRLSSEPPITKVAGQRAASNRHQRSIGCDLPHAIIAGVAEVDRTIGTYGKPTWRVKLSVNSR